MGIAAKFGDPVLGIDVHAVVVPPSPAPVPLPHPFVGVVFDPIGAAIGAALGKAFGGGGPVFVNGMPVGNAGTDVKGAPHIPTPPGASFHPSDVPDHEGTMVTGSKTVNMAGSSMGREMSVVSSCGYPINAPTSLCMAVPMGPPVNIGGPDTFDFFTAVTRGIRTKWFSNALNKLFKVKPGSRLQRAICFLTGHPVDVMTGEVVTDLTDFSLPGLIPLVWERNYWSRETEALSLGPGWYGPLDVGLHEVGRGLVVRLPDGRRKPHDALRPGEAAWDDLDRYTLRRDDRGDGYRLTTWDGTTYHFGRVDNGPVTHPLLEISDRCQNEVRFEYERGRCRKIVDTAGRELELRWTKLGRLEAVLFEGEPLVRYAYTSDGTGLLAAAFDPLGHAFRYEYRGGVMVRETNRNGLSFHFEYDWDHPEGWCIRTWGDGGIYDRRIRYDKHGHFTMVDDSRGGRTHYWGNVAGLVEKMLDPMGVVTTYAWDEHCHKTAETDGEGNRTEWKYDGRGNTVEEKDPLGRVTRRAYDAQNELVRVVDPAGGAWRIERDRNGNPIHVANPAGALSRYAFDDRGRPTELEDPSGRRVRLGWSDRSDLESLTIGATGSGRTTSFEHDSQGRLVASLDAGGRTSRAVHDAAGRVTHIEQPDGERLVLAYDPEGNVVEQVDALGRRVSLRYAGLNRLVEQTDPMNFKVRLAYDTEEDLVAVENPIGERYRFEVDRAGRLSREIGFDGVRTSYLRDKAGQLVKVLGPDHKAISLERDALGRIVRQAFADGEERYAFDLLGSLVAIDAPAGRTSFARDALGRMLGERHEPAGADSAHEVSSHYDASGLRLERETTLGHRATYAWDDAWQLTGISAGPSRALQQPELRRLGLPSLLAPDWLMRIERDPLGLELARVLPGAVRSAWARDGFGRPERQTVTGPAARTRGGAVPARPSDTLLDVRYQWRGADQIAALVDARTGATTRYEHDPRGHLVRTLLADGRVEHRASDAVGNLFRTPDGSDRVYGPGGRLERVGATELRYDARGNLVEKRLADGARWTYRWTHSGTLAEVARPDGTRVEFMYDALGRRLTKSADGTTTEYVWDGDDLVHERRRVTREGEVQPLITWIFEPGTFAPVAKIVGRKRYAVVCDHLGTPSALFTEDGRLAWRGELDTWGRLQERREGIAPEDWTDNPWRYPGQYEDAETGLYYNRHRYFDPELGRYISQDPIGLLGGTALYSYVRDPLGWLDPDGLKPCGFDQEAKAKLLASKPVGMLNAHRHHIVMEGLFSGWSAANRKFVTGAQDLLKDLGIKIQGKFNAAWAKNAGHSVEYAKKVFEDLTKAAASKAGKAAKAKAVTDKLEEIGKLLGTGGY